MKSYIVTYDLMKPGQNYDSLIAAIKKLPSCSVLLSAWLIRSSSSAREIYDYLRQYMDSGDFVLVAELVPGNSYGWLKQEAWNFLNK